MSSKFKELMAQARHRQVEDGDGDLPGDALEAEVDSTLIPSAQVPPATVAKAAPSRPTAAVAESQIAPAPNIPGSAPDHAAQAPQLAVGEARRRGRPRGKRSHPDFEQVSAYISKRTHVQVKIALLQEGEGREFSELVEELLDDWLKR